MSSSSISLLVLLVGIALPLFVARCSFRRPPLACLQCAMFGCCLCLSAALFVIAHRPVIINDCVASRQPPAHLVALVSPAAGTFVSFWTWLSSFLSSSLRAAARAAARACQQTRSLGGSSAGPSALAAVVIVLPVRRGGGQTKPCTTPLI